MNFAFRLVLGNRAAASVLG